MVKSAATAIENSCDGTSFLLKFTELEAIAMKTGLDQKEHVNKTNRLASRTASTAMLSATMQLQFTNELLPDKATILATT
jgi:hypothetical protein